MLYSGYASSVMALQAQSKAMQIVSLNVANVNTGGYKSSNTTFSTVLAKTLFEQSDIGGVKPQVRQLVEKPGNMLATDDPLDVALNGDGFFVFNTQIDGKGETLYGRDGSLDRASGGSDTRGKTYTDPISGKVSNYDEMYLVDKNGYFLQGYALDAEDKPTGELQAMRIDTFTFTDQQKPTTTASLGLNLPSTTGANQGHVASVSAYDTNGDKIPVTLSFRKQPTPENTWTVSAAINGGEVTAPTDETLTFRGDGLVEAPDKLTVTGTSPDGGALNFELDIESMTQFDGPLQVVFNEYDGRSRASLVETEFSKDGYVMGRFSDATIHKLYMLPYATVPNPNGLLPRNGNVYEISERSGPVSLKTVPETGGSTTFSPNVREGSNVQLDEQFTTMIVTQNAYRAASTMFTKEDEMHQTAIELKR